METKGKPSNLCCRQVLVFFMFAILLAVSAPGSERRKGLAAKMAAEDEDFPEFLKPQLLHADSDPTLRYPIASFSGWSVFSTSYGWFDVTREGIRYTVVEPRNKEGEGFEASRDEISDIGMKSGYLRFRTSKKMRTIFCLPRDRWGKIHSGPGALSASSNNAVGTASIQQALKNFDRLLAMVNPPAAPAPAAPAVVTNPTPTPPPAPPTIVLIEPSVARSGQTIEVSSPSLTIRGVAMDSSGLPVVSINGNPANLKPRDTRAAEFWSEQISLHAGENSFEVVATNSAQAANKFAFIAHFKPPAPPPPPKPPKARPSPNAVPLAKAEILELLKGMPSSQVAALVKENGIQFTPTEDDLNRIRAAGGGDDVIEAIRDAATPSQ